MFSCKMARLEPHNAILYTGVAVLTVRHRRNSSSSFEVLASHCRKVGNFRSVSVDLLARYNETLDRELGPELYRAERSYIFGRCCVKRMSTFYHCFCLVDPNFPEDKVKEFLVALAVKVRSGADLTDDLVRNVMDFHNRDRIDEVREQVESVKDTMRSNIEAVVNRGEQLESVIIRTEGLSANSVQFNTTSRSLARRFWWQNAKLWVGVSLAVLIFVYIVISVSCGGLSWPYCIGKN